MVPYVLRVLGRKYMMKEKIALVLKQPIGL